MAIMHVNGPDVAAIMVLAFVLFGWGRFRSGNPRPPAHPLPSEDTKILNRPDKL
jgi:hypothetical protein